MQTCHYHGQYADDQSECPLCTYEAAFRAMSPVTTQAMRWVVRTWITGSAMHDPATGMLKMALDNLPPRTVRVYFTQGDMAAALRDLGVPDRLAGKVRGQMSWQESPHTINLTHVAWSAMIIEPPDITPRAKAETCQGPSVKDLIDRHVSEIRASLAEHDLEHEQVSVTTARVENRGSVFTRVNLVLRLSVRSATEYPGATFDAAEILARQLRAMNWALMDAEVAISIDSLDLRVSWLM